MALPVDPPLDRVFDEDEDFGDDDDDEDGADSDDDDDEAGDDDDDDEVEDEGDDDGTMNAAAPTRLPQKL